MKHIHHIIPRHMGGTDEPSNLIELSVEDHAEAHKELYEKYGHKEDLCAWKGLTKQIGKEELFLLKSSIGGLNNKGVPKSEEHRRKMRIIGNNMKGKHHSELTKKRISEAAKGNTNSKNHSSSKYKKTQSNAMKKAWAKRKKKGAVVQ